MCVCWGRGWGVDTFRTLLAFLQKAGQRVVGPGRQGREVGMCPMAPGLGCLGPSLGGAALSWPVPRLPEGPGRRSDGRGCGQRHVASGPCRCPTRVPHPRTTKAGRPDSAQTVECRTSGAVAADGLRATALALTGPSAFGPLCRVGRSSEHLSNPSPEWLRSCVAESDIRCRAGASALQML